jgi:hypothetical protein
MVISPGKPAVSPETRLTEIGRDVSAYRVSHTLRVRPETRRGPRRSARRFLECLFYRPMNVGSDGSITVERVINRWRPTTPQGLPARKGRATAFPYPEHAKPNMTG